MGKHTNNGSSVNIVFQKPYYLASEIVSGQVDVKLTQPVQANNLMVKFVGMEKTKIENTVHYQDAQGNPQVKHETFKEKKEFFKQSFVLQTFNGGIIQPGAYSLPFQYQLPADLPGVFYDERKEADGDKIKAAIMYKVKVCLDVRGSDLEDKEFLVINSLVSKVPQPIALQNEKKFMFGGSGKLRMFVELAKNVFLPGETLFAKVRLDNESKKDVAAVKIKLMRELTTKAQGRVKHVVQEIQRKKFAGCKAKSKSEQMIDLPLSPKSFGTTQGKLVSCLYHIDIECDIAMAADLEVHPPVIIALLPLPGVQMFNPFAAYSGFK